MFRFLQELIDMEQVGCIGKGKGSFEQGNRKIHMSIGSCLRWEVCPERGKEAQQVVNANEQPLV